MDKGHAHLIKKIRLLLETESLMGAVVLLKSLNPQVASQVLKDLPHQDQKRLYDAWLGSGEPLLAELPVREKAEQEHPVRSTLDSVPYFPDHFVSEVTAVLWIVCLISILTIFAPAGLETKANPLSTPVGVKPEWYFLFLYSLLRFFPPAVGVLALMASGFLLALLPFLDKNPELRPSKRKLALSACMLFLLTIIALTLIGAYGN